MLKLRCFIQSFAFILYFISVRCETEHDINKLISGFEALQKQVQSQETRIAALEDTVASQNNEIARLTAEVTYNTRQRLKLNRDIEKLKDVVRWHSLSNTSLSETQQDRMKSNQFGVRTEEHRPLPIPVKKLLPNLVPISKKGKKRFLMENSYNAVVAFQASIAENQRTVDIRTDQTIVFDTVNLNVGNGYHSRHGLFVAPVAGIYIFSTTVAFWHTTLMNHIDIEKNGVEIAGGFAYDTSKGYSQCSVTVVVDLAVNDEVVVSVERHNNVTVYGDRLTSFMGCLIHTL